MIGVRLSPERFGMKLDDSVELAKDFAMRPRLIFLICRFGMFSRSLMRKKGEEVVFVLLYFDRTRGS